MHILKFTEWEIADKWYCNDVIDLGKRKKSYTFAPARLFELEPVDYVKLLVEKYHATIVSFTEESNLLVFRFDKYADCHRLVLDVNRVARKKGFLV